MNCQLVKISEQTLDCAYRIFCRLVFWSAGTLLSGGCIVQLEQSLSCPALQEDIEERGHPCTSCFPFPQPALPLLTPASGLLGEGGGEGKIGLSGPSLEPSGFLLLGGRGSVLQGSLWGNSVHISMLP